MEGTFEVDVTAWSKDLRLSADGEGIVAWAGAVPVRMLADRTGLTQGLSAVLARRGFDPLHDRGRVLADVATAIACGARDIVDVEALRAQAAVFGPVASDTTARRALAEVGGRARTAIGRVRAAARAHVWALLPGGLPESRFAGGVCQPGVVVLRIDGSIVPTHSKKERAAPTFKKTFGHHPLGCWIDNTEELAALMLRPGNAGSNTADDLIAVLHEAIAQVPRRWRRRLLITSDGAGASHDLIDWAQRQNHAADRTVEYSIGFDVDADVRAAVGRLPADRWRPGLDATTGALRGDIDVAEITDLLRDRLKRTGWPTNMRVIVRRTKLAPGLGHLPSKSWTVNLAWCHAITIAVDLLAWLKLLGCPDIGTLAKAEPATLRYRIPHVPARLAHHARIRWLRVPATWPWATALTHTFDRIHALPTPKPG